MQFVAVCWLGGWIVSAQKGSAKGSFQLQDQVRRVAMLIKWVKDSVLRCFANSYKLTSKIEKLQHKTVATQPNRKVAFSATEIRAAEKSKGGMAYEVIIAEPQLDQAPKRPPSPPKGAASIEDIQNKLKAAEERRQSLEALRLSQLADKWCRIEEASQKKAEFNTVFMTQTKEQLEKKMEVFTENRETFINGMLAKLKDHDERVLEVRKSLENQKEEIKENIEKKLAVASEKRDENIQKKLEKLKEHEENVLKVKRAKEEKTQQLEKQIKSKLEIANEKREAAMQRKLENLKEHDMRVLAVRHTNEYNVQLLSQKIGSELQKRLEKAVCIKTLHLQAVKAKGFERDRHVEEVRQNKLNVEASG